MKVRFLGTLLIALLTFFSCDDTTGSLGIDMLPDADGITAHTITFDVTTESYLADSVYAKSSIGYVGRFTDPDFGYYESSFLTELNCTQDFKLPDVYKYDAATQTGSGTMAGDSVVSTRLVVYYSSWFGDSLNACRMSVYEIDKGKKLSKNRYTNISPEEYIQEKNLLGRKAYTAYDTAVPDSIRYETDEYGEYTYYPAVVFPLDKKAFGEERILKPYRENPSLFRNSDSFIENIFSGVYIKSDYGDGTILYIDRVDLQMQFCFHHVDSLGVALKKKDGTDSLYYSTQTIFASTKEVIQANQFLNSEKIKEKVEGKNEQGHTYIKSPVGIFTQATIPYDEINEQLAGDTLNAVKLTFDNYNQEDKYKFSMSVPETVLLIRKKDMKGFFENNQVSNNVTTYIATHNTYAINQYTFNNIARLITTSITEKNDAKKEAGASWNEEEWEKENDWGKVLLIPVKVVYDSNGTTMTAVENDLKPAYAKLKGGREGSALKMEVSYIKFNTTSDILF